MISALIIDDEVHAREEMRALLAEVGQIEVLGECSNGIDGLKMINQFKPDVVFLDIQMPVINGFEMLNMVHQEIMPHVVFVTAFDQYTLKAFEEKTLDYLLKPIEASRLAKTVNKIREFIDQKKAPEFEVEQITKVPCFFGNRIKLINLEGVEFVSSTPTGVQVATHSGEHFTEVTLKVLDERSSLVRCHKQHLINLDTVAEIILMEAGLARVVTHSGLSVPVSRRYLKILKRKLLI